MIPFLFFMFAGAFWQDKPVADWTDIELVQIMVESPWAQSVGSPVKAAAAPTMQIHIATADLVLQAEKERERRAKAKRKPDEPEKEDPLYEEYKLWLEDNRATQIVVAIRLGTNTALSQQAEVKHMEQDSYLQVGKKKFKITGHFPPTATDPYLRFSFPRPELGDEKTITFSVYVPGLPIPFREAQFRLKDMVVDGKLEL